MIIRIQPIAKTAQFLRTGSWKRYLFHDPSVQAGSRQSAVADTVYAVDFAHKLRGLNRPGMEVAVQLLIGATKGALGRPVVKKTAVLKSEVIAMLDFVVPDFDNFDWGTVRAALFVVLAFCLEARFDDLIDLCGDSFFDYGTYITLFVELTPFRALVRGGKVAL